MGVARPWGVEGGEVKRVGDGGEKGVGGKLRGWGMGGGEGGGKLKGWGGLGGWDWGVC